MSQVSRTRNDYQIGIICALAVEKAAVEAMLDGEPHPSLEKQERDSSDSNDYTLGQIGVHNVVIACLPAGLMGNGPAAVVANDMRRSFPIQFGLMVGIGGGVWSEENDIRLGDIVVCIPHGKHGGVVQWDFGKTVQGSEFWRSGSLNRPPTVLLNAVQRLRANHLKKGSQVVRCLSEMFIENPYMAEKFSYQGAEHDKLFNANYQHSSGKTCDGCEEDKRVTRMPRPDSTPQIHYGTIASGNQVVKDGLKRDQIAREEGVICFEMEAAGLMDSFPCLVVRGICDYADSHKNKKWQAYAAATAAAFAKSILSFIDKQQALNEASQRISRDKSIILFTDGGDQKCLQALFVTNPCDDMAKVQDTKDKRLENTCFWILKDPEYLKWLYQNQSKVLWVHGNPGKGKTMLAISQIQELSCRIESLNLTGSSLLYFFCDAKDNRRGNAIAILRGLLYQLLCQHPGATRYLRDEYEKQKDELFSGPNAQQALWRIFESVLDHVPNPTAWLVVDALDECEAESRHILLRQIKSRLDQYKKTRGQSHIGQEKWLLTSRNDTSIKEALIGSLDISLEDNSANIIKDVQRFIDAKVQILDRKKRYKRNIKDWITQNLREKAEGTFLWVSLACAELEKAPSIAVKKVLERLPSDLNVLYQQLLSRILDNEDVELAAFAREILLAVLVAVRPLTLYELAILAGLPTEHCDDISSILEYAAQCGSFLTIRKNAVHFVHQSAKDYLSSTNALNISHNAGHENKVIAIRCLDYICSGVFENRQIEISDDESSEDGSYDYVVDLSDFEDTGDEKYRQDPVLDSIPGLLTYPVIFWMEHGRLASLDILDYFNQDHEFVRQRSNIRDTWFNTYWRITVTTSGYKSHNSSALHLASYSGICPLAAAVLKWTSPPIDLKDEKEMTALCWAAQNGHEAVVRMLLKIGADPNIKCGRYGGTALLAASRRGQEAVVKLLLDTRSVDANSKDKNSRTPLWWAAMGGHVAVVKLLLDTGKVDPDSKNDIDSQTPLWWAAKGGHDPVVKLLLDTGKVDADLKSTNGWTPLWWAAKRGHEAVVRLLLNTGKVNASLVDDCGWTPLSWAAANGCEAVVKLLIKVGTVDADWKDGDGWTPLSLAVNNGHEAIVKLLLDTGKVSIDSKDIDDLTPLSLAARNGNEAIVKLLLETRKVDIDSKDKDRRTPLLLAAKNGRRGVVKLLLDTGKVDVSSMDKDNRTPLWWAVENEYDIIARLLLDTGNLKVKLNK